MWSAPLHDVEFVEKVLKHIEENKNLYGTAARMKGMLTVAKEVIGPLIILQTSFIFCLRNFRSRSTSRQAGWLAFSIVKRLRWMTSRELTFYPFAVPGSSRLTLY